MTTNLSKPKNTLSFLTRSLKALLSILGFIRKTRNLEYSDDEQITNKEILNTPFRVVGSKDKGYFVALGMYKLSENKKTAKEAVKVVNNKNWEFLIPFIGALISDSQAQSLTKSNTQ